MICKKTPEIFKATASKNSCGVMFFLIHNIETNNSNIFRVFLFQNCEDICILIKFTCLQHKVS